MKPRLWLGWLKSRRVIIALVAAILLLIWLVYGLYRLPFGPAIYTMLLVFAVACGVALSDMRQYRKRLALLRLLQRQAPVALPDPLREAFSGQDMQLELFYEIAATLEARCRAAEQQCAESLAAARDYYTLWSHQIKAPIAAMRLLLCEQPPEIKSLELELFKTEQYVEMALGYQRLSGVENDLVIRQQPLDVLVRQAVKRVSVLFIYKKLAINLGELEATVLTDEKWLVFILEQLLTNAVKYTPAGGVSVYLSPDSPCTLVVEDTGIGIQACDLPRVFDWGYTGVNGRLDKRATGIGLSLCRQAAALLGHTIAVESTLGVGTRVLLTLGRPALETE